MFGPPKATPKSIAQKVFEAAGDIYMKIIRNLSLTGSDSCIPLMYKDPNEFK